MLNLFILSKLVLFTEERLDIVEVFFEDTELRQTIQVYCFREYFNAKIKKNMCYCHETAGLVFVKTTKSSIIKPSNLKIQEDATFL